MLKWENDRGKKALYKLWSRFLHLNIFQVSSIGHQFVPETLIPVPNVESL